MRRRFYIRQKLQLIQFSSTGLSVNDKQMIIYFSDPPTGERRGISGVFFWA